MQKSLFDTFTPYTATQSITPPSGLWLRDSGGEFVPAGVQDILRAARAVAEGALPRGVALDKPNAVKDFFRLKLNASMEHEVLGMALLNTQFELIEYLEPFRGTLTQAAVYPREVVKIALKANAGAVIIAHNHPSGRLEPSEADRTLTRHLREALQLVDVRLLDHILVAGGHTLSFAEHGFL